VPCKLKRERFEQAGRRCQGIPQTSISATSLSGRVKPDKDIRYMVIGNWMFNRVPAVITLARQ